MIKEGTIVKGSHSGEAYSGMVVRSKTHTRARPIRQTPKPDVAATVAEVLFQVGTNERAIYVYVNDEFHLIKDTVSGIAPSNLEIA
jgi:hypothetical protein